MTPAALAALHAAAFTVPRPWSAPEFAVLLGDPAVFLVRLPPGVSHPRTPVGYLGQDEGHDAGFALGRSVLDEAELLTVAVLPGARGRGIGRRLVAGFLAQATARGAARAFLEVAEDNAAARALYVRAGFAVAGRRRGYFLGPGGGRIDAIVMARDLPVS